MNGHPRGQAKVSVHCRWPPIRGTLTLKCVGRALITWPYKEGGRSRRGSHQAGTTVVGPTDIFGYGESCFHIISMICGQYH